MTEELRSLPAELEGSGRTYASGGQEAIIGYPYSGADIKLLIHMPDENGGHTTSADIEELELEVERLQGELDLLPSDYNGMTDEARAVAEQIDGIPTDGAHAEREERERELREQLIVARDGRNAWEPEDPEYQLFQEHIDEIDEELEEITTQNNANAYTTPRREDLLEQLRAATDALEEMRGAGGLLANAQTKVLAEVQTLSYSIHREKSAYRPLGSVYPKTICRGPRTVSGSMVFTVFHQHIFAEFFERAQLRSTGVGDHDRWRWTTYITDQLPPLDISIVFANEYGNLSYMGIFGVEFINEGMTMSIEDLFIEGVAQYIARDIDLLRKVGTRSLGPNRGVGSSLTGSSLLMEDLRSRVAGRRNPFL